MPGAGLEPASLAAGVFKTPVYTVPPPGPRSDILFKYSTQKQKVSNRFHLKKAYLVRRQRNAFLETCPRDKVGERRL
jgi:hypothetical protein